MNWYEKIGFTRNTDFQVENDGKLYLERWFLIPQNWVFNIYLHRFSHSDLPVYHDHPWFSLSFILEGAFIEHKPNKKPQFCGEREFYFRTPFTKHWLQMTGNVVWTLFITGPVMRPWGFIENGKWVYHKTFLAARKREENLKL